MQRLGAGVSELLHDRCDEIALLGGGHLALLDVIRAGLLQSRLLRIGVRRLEVDLREFLLQKMLAVFLVCT